MSRLLGLTIQDTSTLKSKWMSRSALLRGSVLAEWATRTKRTVCAYGKIATSGVFVNG